jgi:hypothetical protein
MLVAKALFARGVVISFCPKADEVSLVVLNCNQLFGA